MPPEPRVFFENIAGFRTEIRDYHPDRPDARLMLCFHGFGGSATSFRRLAPKLPNDLAMWSFSLPWHGATTGPDQKLSLETYTADLKKLIDWLRPGKVDLMSHSFGSRIAATFAMRYPESTHHLYLIAPGGYYPPEDLMFRFLGSFPMRHLIRRDIFLYPFVKFLIPNLPAGKKEQTYSALRNLGRSFPGISFKADGTIRNLKNFKGKTVLIVGAKDRLLNPSYAPKIARWYHNCRVETISGAGHLPMVEKPVAVAAIIGSMS